MSGRTLAPAAYRRMLPSGMTYTSLSPGGGAGRASDVKRRRRPPQPAEQARRQAWGRKWGALRSQSWAQIKRGLD